MFESEPSIYEPELSHHVTQVYKRKEEVSLKTWADHFSQPLKNRNKSLITLLELEVNIMKRKCCFLETSQIMGRTLAALGIPNVCGEVSKQFLQQFKTSKSRTKRLQKTTKPRGTGLYELPKEKVLGGGNRIKKISTPRYPPVAERWSDVAFKKFKDNKDGQDVGNDKEYTFSNNENITNKSTVVNLGYSKSKKASNITEQEQYSTKLNQTKSYENKSNTSKINTNLKPDRDKLVVKPPTVKTPSTEKESLIIVEEINRSFIPDESNKEVVDKIFNDSYEPQAPRISHTVEKNEIKENSEKWSTTVAIDEPSCRESKVQNKVIKKTVRFNDNLCSYAPSPKYSDSFEKLSTNTSKIVTSSEFDHVFDDKLCSYAPSPEYSENIKKLDTNTSKIVILSEFEHIFDEIVKSSGASCTNITNKSENNRFDLQTVVSPYKETVFKSNESSAGPIYLSKCHANKEQLLTKNQPSSVVKETEKYNQRKTKEPYYEVEPYHENDIVIEEITTSLTSSTGESHNKTKNESSVVDQNCESVLPSLNSKIMMEDTPSSEDVGCKTLTLQLNETITLFKGCRENDLTKNSNNDTFNKKSDEKMAEEICAEEDLDEYYALSDSSESLGPDVKVELIKENKSQMKPQNSVPLLCSKNTTVIEETPTTSDNIGSETLNLGQNKTSSLFKVFEEQSKPSEVVSETKCTNIRNKMSEEICAEEDFDEYYALSDSSESLGPDVEVELIKENKSQIKPQNMVSLLCSKNTTVIEETPTTSEDIGSETLNLGRNKTSSLFKVSEEQSKLSEVVSETKCTNSKNKISERICAEEDFNEYYALSDSSESLGPDVEVELIKENKSQIKPQNRVSLPCSKNMFMNEESPKFSEDIGSKTLNLGRNKSNTQLKVFKEQKKAKNLIFESGYTNNKNKMSEQISPVGDSDEHTSLSESKEECESKSGTECDEKNESQITSQNEVSLFSHPKNGTVVEETPSSSEDIVLENSEIKLSLKDNKEQDLTKDVGFQANNRTCDSNYTTGEIIPSEESEEEYIPLSYISEVSSEYNLGIKSVEGHKPPFKSKTRNSLSDFSQVLKKPNTTHLTRNGCVNQLLVNLEQKAVSTQSPNTKKAFLNSPQNLSPTRSLSDREYLSDSSQHDSIILSTTSPEKPGKGYANRTLDFETQKYVKPFQQETITKTMTAVSNILSNYHKVEKQNESKNVNNVSELVSVPPSLGKILDYSMANDTTADLSTPQCNKTSQEEISRRETMNIKIMNAPVKSCETINVGTLTKEEKQSEIPNTSVSKLSASICKTLFPKETSIENVHQSQEANERSRRGCFYECGSPIQKVLETQNCFSTEPTSEHEIIESCSLEIENIQPTSKDVKTNHDKIARTLVKNNHQDPLVESSLSLEQQPMNIQCSNKEPNNKEEIIKVSQALEVNNKLNTFQGSFSSLQKDICDDDSDSGAAEDTVSNVLFVDVANNAVEKVCPLNGLYTEKGRRSYKLDSTTVDAETNALFVDIDSDTCSDGDFTISQIPENLENYELESEQAVGNKNRIMDAHNSLDKTCKGSSEKSNHFSTSDNIRATKLIFAEEVESSKLNNTPYSTQNSQLKTTDSKIKLSNAKSSLSTQDSYCKQISSTTSDTILPTVMKEKVLKNNNSLANEKSKKILKDKNKKGSQLNNPITETIFSSIIDEHSNQAKRTNPHKPINSIQNFNSQKTVSNIKNKDVPTETQNKSRSVFDDEIQITEINNSYKFNDSRSQGSLELESTSLNDKIETMSDNFNKKPEKGSSKINNLYKSLQSEKNNSKNTIPNSFSSNISPIFHKALPEECISNYTRKNLNKNKSNPNLQGNRLKFDSKNFQNEKPSFKKYYSTQNNLHICNKETENQHNDTSLYKVINNSDETLASMSVTKSYHDDEITKTGSATNLHFEPEVLNESQATSAQRVKRTPGQPKQTSSDYIGDPVKQLFGSISKSPCKLEPREISNNKGDKRLSSFSCSPKESSVRTNSGNKFVFCSSRESHLISMNDLGENFHPHLNRQVLVDQNSRSYGSISPVTLRTNIGNPTPNKENKTGTLSYKCTSTRIPVFKGKHFESKTNTFNQLLNEKVFKGYNVANRAEVVCSSTSKENDLININDIKENIHQQLNKRQVVYDNEKECVESSSPVSLHKVYIQNLKKKNQKGTSTYETSSKMSVLMEDRFIRNKNAKLKILKVNEIPRNAELGCSSENREIQFDKRYISSRENVNINHLKESIHPQFNRKKEVYINNKSCVESKTPVALKRTSDETVNKQNQRETSKDRSYSIMPVLERDTDGRKRNFKPQLFKDRTNECSIKDKCSPIIWKGIEHPNNISNFEQNSLEQIFESNSDNSNVAHPVESVDGSSDSDVDSPKGDMSFLDFYKKHKVVVDIFKNHNENYSTQECRKRKYNSLEVPSDLQGKRQKKSIYSPQSNNDSDDNQSLRTVSENSLDFGSNSCDEVKYDIMSDDTEFENDVFNNHPDSQNTSDDNIVQNLQDGSDQMSIQTDSEYPSIGDSEFIPSSPVNMNAGSDDSEYLTSFFDAKDDPPRSWSSGQSS